MLDGHSQPPVAGGVEFVSVRWKSITHAHCSSCLHAHYVCVTWCVCVCVCTCAWLGVLRWCIVYRLHLFWNCVLCSNVRTVFRWFTFAFRESVTLNTDVACTRFHTQTRKSVQSSAFYLPPCASTSSLWFSIFQLFLLYFYLVFSVF